MTQKDQGASTKSLPDPVDVLGQAPGDRERRSQAFLDAVALARDADGVIGRRNLPGIDPSRKFHASTLLDFQHERAAAALERSGMEVKDPLAGARAILTQVGIQHAAEEELALRSSGMLTKLVYRRSSAADVAGALGGIGGGKSIEDLVHTKLSNDDLGLIRTGRFDELKNPMIALNLKELVETAQFESMDARLDAAIVAGAETTRRYKEDLAAEMGIPVKSKGPESADTLAIQSMRRGGAER